MEDMDEFYTEDDREIGIKHCDGFDVYYNFYGEGEYSVNGYWYPTLESAMHPIENRTDKRPMEEMQEKQTVTDAENPDDLDKAFMERFEQRMQEEKKYEENITTSCFWRSPSSLLQPGHSPQDIQSVCLYVL